MRMESGCFWVFKNNSKTIKACKIRAVFCKVGFLEPFPIAKCFWVGLKCFGSRCFLVLFHPCCSASERHVSAKPWLNILFLTFLFSFIMFF